MSDSKAIVNIACQYGPNLCSCVCKHLYKVVTDESICPHTPLLFSVCGCFSVMCWGYVCVKALVGDREEGVGGQSSGTEADFQP